MRRRDDLPHLSSQNILHEVFGPVGRKPPMTKLNIILILADDMGFSDIGCFGSEIRTPNIDRMAANGAAISSMYNCARCCPTRASLLTGLYPHKAGIGHMGANLGAPAYQGYLRNDAVTVNVKVSPSSCRAASHPCALIHARLFVVMLMHAC